MVEVPEAMALATATPDGAPSVRMVLLKAFDERGLVFYSHHTSRKGRELEANPQAALLFHWPPLGRQVRVEGRVERVSAEESDAYFATRPRDAQLGAHRLAAERAARFAGGAGRAARRAGERPGRRPGAAAADVGRLPARSGGLGVLAAPRQPPPRPLPLRARVVGRLADRAALSVTFRPVAATGREVTTSSRDCDGALRAARPRRRRPRPSTRRRPRAGPGSPRSASRVPRASRCSRPASASAESCFATAWRVTGSSAASSVAVAVPRAATASTSERRPASPSAAKTRSTPPRAPSTPGAQLERRSELGRRTRRRARASRRRRLELDRDAPAVVPVEDEPLRLLELAHDRAPLVAVAPAEDALAAGARVELDLRREPLLEPLRLGQRLPDLVGLLGHDDLPLDLHPLHPRHLRNLLVAY